MPPTAGHSADSGWQGSDAAVAALVRLLIIDEVHLLNDERGPVIETLVARTQRQVRLRSAQASSLHRCIADALLPNVRIRLNGSVPLRRWRPARA